MTLSELIEQLEKANPAAVVRNGFSTAHSYRGYYEDLAFEPATFVTVATCSTAPRRHLARPTAGGKVASF